MARRDRTERILENIDRARAREAMPPSSGTDRQATGRALNTEVPPEGTTTTERLQRLFGLIEQGYLEAASSEQLRPLAARFQAIGDIADHRARGDISVAMQYMDSERFDDIGMIPFEVKPEQVKEAKEHTRTSRPDTNALRVLREELRKGVVASFQKIEPRLRDAIRGRADHGHVAVQVTLDVRPHDPEASTEAPE
jgi:hypothetical protein